MPAGRSRVADIRPGRFSEPSISDSAPLTSSENAFDCDGSMSGGTEKHGSLESRSQPRNEIRGSSPLIRVQVGWRGNCGYLQASGVTPAVDPTREENRPCTEHIRET